MLHNFWMGEYKMKNNYYYFFIFILFLLINNLKKELDKGKLSSIMQKYMYIL